MRAVPPPGLFEWPPDVHKRSQDTTPTIFGCKRAILQKCLFSLGKQRVFEGRVAKNIPLFRSEAATASHLDGNKLTRSLGNTPSALNEKTKKTCFLIFLLSSLFSLLSSLLSRSRQKSPREGGRAETRFWSRRAVSFGDLWRLFWGCFSVVFSVWSLSSLSSSCFCLLLVFDVL